MMAILNDFACQSILLTVILPVRLLDLDRWIRSNQSVNQSASAPSYCGRVGCSCSSSKQPSSWKGSWPFGFLQLLLMFVSLPYWTWKGIHFHSNRENEVNIQFNYIHHLTSYQSFISMNVFINGCCSLLVKIVACLIPFNKQYIWLSSRNFLPIF